MDLIHLIKLNTVLYYDECFFFDLMDFRRATHERHQHVHNMFSRDNSCCFIFMHPSSAWRNWKRCSGVLCDRRMPVKLN